VILTGPGSVWFGNVVIFTRLVQSTANAFTVRFATKVNRAHEQVQFASIWRTCLYAKVRNCNRNYSHQKLSLTLTLCFNNVLKQLRALLRQRNTCVRVYFYVVIPCC